MLLKPRPLKIVFFSSSEFTKPILDSLVQAQGKPLLTVINEHYSSLASDIQKPLNLPKELFTDQQLAQFTIELVGAVSQTNKTLRNQTLVNPIAQTAIDLGLPTFLPKKLNQEWTNSDFLSKGIDFGIVASYGQIISQTILDLAKYKFINWHPSDLPKYRGASPMQTALLNGDNHTALSWIEMTKEMDAGDIWLKIPQSISAWETFSELAQRMSVLGAQTWALVIAKILLANRYGWQGEAQDHTQATFCGKQTKEDAVIEPKNYTAKDLFNRWRAFVQFPKTKFHSTYFQQLVTLDWCVGYCLNFPKLVRESDKIIYTDSEWTQIKYNKQLKTFLHTASGYLEVTKVVLENGKKLNFQGFLMTK